MPVSTSYLHLIVSIAGIPYWLERSVQAIVLQKILDSSIQLSRWALVLFRDFGLVGKSWGGAHEDTTEG